VFGPSDVAFHRPVVGCSFSRDGRRVALAVPRYEAALDARPLEVWCRDLESGGGWERIPPLDPDEPVCQPTIAPDGRHLAVLTAKAGSQVLQIFDMEDISAPPLELKGLPLRVEAPKWCDGTGELMCLGYDAEGWRRVWRWRTLEGEPEACTPAGVHAGDFAIEPSGDSMAWVHLPDMLAASSERLPIRVTTRDGGEGIEHRVPGRPVGYMAWSPGGRWLAYLARRVGHRLSAARLWIVDPRRWPEDPSAARCLTRDLEGWITGFDWSHDGESVVLAITQGTYGRLERVGLDGERASIGHRRSYLSGPHSDRSTGRLIYLEQDGAAPQRLCLHDPDGGQSQTLTDFHEPMAAMALGPVETVRWTGDDGMILDGVLVRPPGRSGPAPMLVWLHGGPAEVISRTFSPYFQAIAAAGYAVFAPNFRGSNGRGDGFLRASIDDLGGADASDVLCGIDRMVQIGVSDTERTALMGWSYGATLALLIASKSDVPRAVIAGAPVADWVSFFGAPRYPSMYRDYFPGPLWEDRTRLDAASPISHIADVNVPTLLLHGGADGVVPCSHSRLLYRALRERGVETDLMIYPAEGHVFGRPTVVQDMLERVLSWLETHAL
jgi:dipeptidyl aminopeptidase/acylaminoacyl peptidase